MQEQNNFTQVHKLGYVRLIDHMGSDKRICDSARVSFAADKEIKTIEEDANLIDYLIRNFHETPFEMVEFAFEIKCPIFVARQIFRHRLFSYNEISGRYTEMPNEFFLPEDFYEQSESNKQGRKDVTYSDKKQITLYKNSMEESFDLYSNTVDKGIAKEQARINLPLATYTRFMMKGNLRTWLHFLLLRLDNHAQKEIRDYAEAIFQFIKPIVPITIDAWEERVRYAVTFSRKEINFIRKLFNENPGLLETTGFSKRDMRIFQEKLS